MALRSVYNLTGSLDDPVLLRQIATLVGPEEHLLLAPCSLPQFNFNTPDQSRAGREAAGHFTG